MLQTVRSEVAPTSASDEAVWWFVAIVAKEAGASATGPDPRWRSLFEANGAMSEAIRLGLVETRNLDWCTGDELFVTDIGADWLATNQR